MPIDASFFNQAQTDTPLKLAQILSSQNIQNIGLQQADTQNKILQTQRATKLSQLLNEGAPDPATMAQKLANNGFSQEAANMQSVVDAAQQRKDAETTRRASLLAGANARIGAKGGTEQAIQEEYANIGLSPDQIQSKIDWTNQNVPAEKRADYFLGVANPEYLMKANLFKQEQTQRAQDKTDIYKQQAIDKADAAAAAVEDRKAAAKQAALDRAQLQRQHEELIMGILPGSAGASNQFAALAHSIATGDIPAQTALSRAPLAARGQIIDMATKENPDFANAYSTRKQTEMQFTSAKNGSPGAVVASFNKSLSHLDTLGQLGDALKNGNTPLINKIGNYLGEQTGNPAPTNFDAAKQIVGDEVVKAIVGAGGAQADREKAQKVLESAKTPEQLKGAIKTIQDLMIGQLKPLEQQYTTGARKNDFRDKFLSPQAKALMSAGEAAQPAQPVQDPQMVALAKKALQPGSGADALHIAAAKKILGIQ